MSENLFPRYDIKTLISDSRSRRLVREFPLWWHVYSSTISCCHARGKEGGPRENNGHFRRCFFLPPFALVPSDGVVRGSVPRGNKRNFVRECSQIQIETRLLNLAANMRDMQSQRLSSRKISPASFRVSVGPPACLSIRLLDNVHLLHRLDRRGVRTPDRRVREMPVGQLKNISR